MGVLPPADRVILDVADPLKRDTVIGLRAVDELSASGERRAVKLTLPAKSLRLTRLTSTIERPPCGRLRVTGLDPTVKSGGN